MMLDYRNLFLTCQKYVKKFRIYNLIIFFHFVVVCKYFQDSLILYLKHFEWFKISQFYRNTGDSTYIYIYYGNDILICNFTCPLRIILFSICQNSHPLRLTFSEIFVNILNFAQNTHQKHIFLSLLTLKSFKSY